MFSDFGENFEILDETGEDCETMCIKYISKEKNAILKVAKAMNIPKSNHGYVFPDDFIPFIFLNLKIFLIITLYIKLKIFFIG